MSTELVIIPDQPVIVHGKPRCILMNWHINSNRFRTRVLVGEVYGHPMFDDGTKIHTSAVLSLNLKEDECETREMIYDLKINYTNDSVWDH
jgi:hypothetical protein